LQHSRPVIYCPFMPTFAKILHLAIVVRDMATSIEWYERVLGFEPTGEVVAGPPEAKHPRQRMVHPGSKLLLAIHEPLQRSGDLFDPDRTGLDHFALFVDDPDDLQAWQARLDQLSVPYRVHDHGDSRFIALHDPDGIAWELWAA
jgi:glyoxylase I family protein